MSSYIRRGNVNAEIGKIPSKKKYKNRLANKKLRRQGAKKIVNGKSANDLFC